MASDPGVSGNGWTADPVSSGDPTSAGFGGTIAGGRGKSFGEKALEWAKEKAPNIASILTTVLTGGNAAAGIVVGLLVKYGMGKLEATGLVNQVKSGELTPDQAGATANSKIMMGLTGAKTIDEAITKTVAAYEKASDTVLGPDRIDLENTIRSAMIPYGRDSTYYEPTATGLRNTVNTQLAIGENGTQGLLSLDQDTGETNFTPNSETTMADTVIPEEVDRRMWDEFMDQWYGVPPYDQTAAKENFKNFFDNATPGTQQEFAGGKLMMGGNGTAYFVPSNGGETVKFTRDTDLAELYNTNQSIKDAMDRAYPIQTAEDLITGNADYLGDQAGTYNDTIQGATDTQTQLLSDLTKRLEDATNKYTTLIDSLTSDAQAGTGYYKPVSFGLGDQTISFVPGANRRAADQIAGFGKDSLTGSSDSLTQQGKWGQTNFDNVNQTARNILNNAQATSPYAGPLTYLDALSKMLPSEEERVQSDLLNDYRNRALQQGLTISNNQIDAQSPGVLDYLQSANLIFGDGGIFGKGGAFNGLFV